MTRVRQIYSGKEFDVVTEDDSSITLRPVPPATGTDFTISRFLFNLKFEDASAPPSTRKADARAKALAKPEPKRKARR